MHDDYRHMFMSGILISMCVTLTCCNLPKLAQWIVSAIGARDNNIKEATATINEQADDLVTLKEQIIDKVKEVTLLEDSNNRKDTELATLKDQIAKKDTELATATTTLVRRNKKLVTAVTLLKRRHTKLKNSKFKVKNNHKVTNALRDKDVTTLKTKPNNIAVRKCNHKNKKKNKGKTNTVLKTQVTTTKVKVDYYTI